MRTDPRRARDSEIGNHSQTERLPAFRRPERLEELLRYFERLLGPLELEELAHVTPSRQPILFLLGCARSGTTLLHQYLAYSGLFTYPTNFVSRFYFAPYLGARLQEMLLASDFRGEILGEPPDLQFASDLGKTKGPLAPHEFWYFWRRFFRFEDVQKLDAAALERADGDLFLRELRAFQSVEDKPLVMKGMFLNWDIPYLGALAPDIHFLHIERGVEANAESILGARLAFFGDESRWYSFRPPGFERVLGLDPVRQATWQVLAANAAAEAGLAGLEDERVLRVRYEDFCAEPRQLLVDLCTRLKLDVRAASARLPDRFEARAQPGLTERDWSAIVADARRFL